ncbi:hypothetical protein M8845_07295 [Gelidibacter japonicus]|uniref:hypothetical protein n=1 Tax=Gelidibacter japonicus TaxID=1962232 RepID=UPI002021FAF2|nr:hypothetical protein [Gelidibacter japonicus]MCL8007226.1 hypothetical protein [Gelidibacter japonicus]
MIKWANKYSKFLRLPQIGEELNTPIKKKDMKSFLQEMVDELPETDEALSESDLRQSGLSYFSVKFFDTLKEYYILFASIPLFLGGSIQIISLMVVGKNYIRFFSTTQLLTDGLIVLIYIFIFLAAVFILIGLGWVFTRGKIPALVLSFSFSYIALRTIIENWTLIRQFDFDSNTESALWLFTVIILSNLIFWIKRPVYISIISYVGLFIIGFYILLLSVNIGISSFIENFSLGNMKNKKNLECVLERDNIEFTDFKVVYYNDKYLFINLKIDQESEIIVLPFQALFEGEACKNTS